MFCLFVKMILTENKLLPFKMHLRKIRLLFWLLFLDLSLVCKNMDLCADPEAYALCKRPGLCTTVCLYFSVQVLEQILIVRGNGFHYDISIHAHNTLWSPPTPSPDNPTHPVLLWSALKRAAVLHKEVSRNEHWATVSSNTSAAQADSYLWENRLLLKANEQICHGVSKWKLKKKKSILFHWELLFSLHVGATRTCSTSGALQYANTLREISIY